MHSGSRVKDTDLQLRIRQLIGNGQLPWWMPARIAASHADGNVCVACDRQIAKEDIEYEVHDDGSGRQLNFHLDCCAMWQRESVHTAGPHVS